MSNLLLIKQTLREVVELAAKSVVLSDAKSKLFCKLYNQTSGGSSLVGEREQLLRHISKEYGVKSDKLYNSIASLATLNKTSVEFAQNFKHSNYEKLSAMLRPEYDSFFTSLSRVEHGIETLVKMRENLLTILSRKITTDEEEEQQLKIMNSNLRSLLSLWFSTGLLSIQQVNWNSPASLVEKVAQYESVHRIRTLKELKSRLSSDRRCFIYTHTSMPCDEPLVILHVALTRQVTARIGDLIIDHGGNSKDNTTIVESSSSPEYTNAIFYSITSCQKGLQQVDLGNSLIKSCVHLLQAEFPTLSQFHTLSPMPKFKEWLDAKIRINDQTTLCKFFTHPPSHINLLEQYFNLNNKSQEEDRLSALFAKIYERINSDEFRIGTMKHLESSSSSSSNPDSVLAEFLQRAGVYYLMSEKKKGYAFDPVCNFHLRNGAQIYRVNYGAEAVEKSWQRSYGLMVNYGYQLNQIEANCVDYLVHKTIKHSDLIRPII